MFPERASWPRTRSLTLDQITKKVPSLPVRRGDTIWFPLRSAALNKAPNDC